MVKNRFLCIPPLPLTVENSKVFVSWGATPFSPSCSGVALRLDSGQCHVSRRLKFHSQAWAVKPAPRSASGFWLPGKLCPQSLNEGSPSEGSCWPPWDSDESRTQVQGGKWEQRDWPGYCVFLNPMASVHSRSSCQQRRWQAAWQGGWFSSRQAPSSSLTLSLAILGVEGYFLLYLPDAAWTSDKL